MTENLLAVQDAARLTRQDVVQLARNAFTVSWLEPDERDGYLDTLETYADTPG